MPTYEYECTSCGHVFERFQSITDKPLKRCPECRCKVRRLIGSGAGIIFKGSGFYETDYRSESYKQAAKREKTTPTTSSSKDKSSGSKEKSAGGKSKTSSSSGSGKD